MTAIRNIFVLLTVFLSCFFVFVVESNADTHSASSASYADVNTAVAAATYGDTVTVPAGSATWSSTLTITKGITLKGAGIGVTNITRSGGNLIDFSPNITTRGNGTTTQYKFEVSGFTFGGSGSAMINLYESNGETIPFRKLLIHDNRFVNTGDYFLYVDGNFWGVIYNNQFAGKLGFMLLGNQDAGWNTFGAGVYGTADNLYFEDNTFSGSAEVWFQTGHGGRYALRYNTFTASYMGNPMFDEHGNQPGWYLCPYDG